MENCVEVVEMRLSRGAGHHDIVYGIGRQMRNLGPEVPCP